MAGKDVPNWKPRVGEPEIKGLDDDGRPMSDDLADAGSNVPDTAGKSKPRRGPLPDPFEKRRSDAPRHPGGSPRPEQDERSDRSS